MLMEQNIHSNLSKDNKYLKRNTWSTKDINDFDELEIADKNYIN